ncbi:unnamed protein product [Triticum turgidum subsp. durum]|uniref:Clp R domain-containing protein n=3 Tax=Triticum TaxID=4564 RepID=A0A9R0TBX9_TRITD|nr:unnamed protein product [Triticum turgidum subsp. durum]
MQHNALDLCLDLALGSLAVTTVVHNSVDPAPSNACVAALKRAQAHQHRGRSAAEVELEKLVVSILDDPSVDRVMRAAGFSSSQIRASVESALTSSKRSRSSKAGCDILATCPAPVQDMIRAGQGRRNQELCRLECQASNAKTGAGGRPAIFGASTASIPPWLRRYKDTTCVRSTYCGASLQSCMQAACRRPKFTELTATNLNILCNALQLRVPRHGNIIPGISCTVLRCRSGVTRTIPSSLSSTKATCLLFLGGDYGGKVAVAQELARLLFGSYAEFTTVQLQSSPNIRTHNGKLALKRQRSPHNDGDLEERLFEAVVENPHRVILMDGVDLQDRDSEMHIMGGGMVRGCNGGVVNLEDAIIVLSASDVLDSRRYVASPSSPRVKRRFGGQKNREKGDDGTEMKRRHGCDLSVCAVVEEEEEEDSLADDDEGIQNGVDGVFLFN